MIQSAVLTTSMLCSMTRTVLPRSTSSWSTSNRCLISWKCRPVVGSSRIYKVFPVEGRTSSLASLIRWASPPDKVVEDWPSLIYSMPTFCRVSSLCLMEGYWQKSPRLQRHPFPRCRRYFFLCKRRRGFLIKAFGFAKRASTHASSMKSISILIIPIPSHCGQDLLYVKAKTPWLISARLAFGKLAEQSRGFHRTV